MSYQDHFKHADDIISHLNTIVPSIADPLLQIKYVGFVAIASVTVYELAIKEIFITFAQKKHKILGNFTESYFEKINGRIKIKNIEDDYISKFGNKYLIKFKTKLTESSKNYLLATHRDIKSSYSNIITWRNDFAHEGKMNSTTTYNEVIKAYTDGKEVIHCLANSMSR